MYIFFYFKIYIFTYITTLYYINILIISNIVVSFCAIYIHYNYIKLHFTYMFMVPIREVAMMKDECCKSSA